MIPHGFEGFQSQKSSAEFKSQIACQTLPLRMCKAASTRPAALSRYQIFQRTTNSLYLEKEEIFLHKSFVKSQILTAPCPLPYICYENPNRA